MASNNRIAKRHPSVLLLAHREDDVQGVAELIAEQTDDFRCLIVRKTALDDIQQLAPKVLLFALSDVKKSICLYNLLIKENRLIKNHYSVLLCSNKESGVAFKCCLKNLFDSYFVYQPLYEKFRLQLIVYDGLKQFANTDTYIESLDAIVQNQNEELNDLIETGLGYKTSLVDEINKHKEEVNSINQNILAQLPDSMHKQLMSELNESHIQPLLNALESSISEKLMGLVDGLKQSQNLNSQLISQLQQPLQSRQSIQNEVTTSNNFLNNGSSPQHSILLVEDNHIYREMISDVLSNVGYEIEQVDDGLAAIKKIKLTQYDLIVMDLFLPNLDGLNTTKHIRNVGKNIKTPVIALTGNKNKQLVKKWAEHGLDGYILKPSTKQEILAVVNKAIGHQL
ncbi:response regulator [Pseudoalteromonas luteoviolacea]|uniref:response regulator n=1 Tax=Pseudoalteromonas luteoviolacea TaxID=43657 RepID=UPI001F36E287|nr:response regulator [Pseudoalteromonas luteoviolacea]MCF6442897.1 response regulator [Pseudoalteromonas luteoviolacea]